ncbi:hypothetical protein [Human adenovirus B3]|uniref:Uncharacterized protein n=1 Tax=Human adenovirus B serotype 3 TaxID=45659 RepID=Q2KSK7_ADE03|nr:hypothetical protein [Human adenovirus B3]ANQ44527.1 hypothetical protein [Human adenovirus B3]
MSEGKSVPDHDFKELILEVDVITGPLFPELEVHPLLVGGVGQSESNIIEEDLAGPGHEISGDSERLRDLCSVINNLSGQNYLIKAVDVVPHYVQF